MERCKLELPIDRSKREVNPDHDELHIKIHIMEKVLHGKRALLERKEKREHTFDEKTCLRQRISGTPRQGCCPKERPWNK